MADNSKGKFYSKTRIVGHIIAIACVARLIYLIKSAGLQDLSFEYKIMIIFWLSGWFFFIPVIHFMNNLIIENYESRRKEGIFNRAFGYYIWTPINVFSLFILCLSK